MSSQSEVFKEIREFKEKGDYVSAWNSGFRVLKDDNNNKYLKRSLFWVCYAAIKKTQSEVLKKHNKTPNENEKQNVNSWVTCIDNLKIGVNEEELDFRFFNLFKGCGEHYESYIKMIIKYGTLLYSGEDLKPYKTAKGESPSLAMKLSREISKAWLKNHKNWSINIDDVLKILNYVNNKSLDSNKIWLQHDISKCLIKANRHKEARKTALNVLKKKRSESWAWSILAETYLFEDQDAAISCFSKGVIESREPSFSISMYFELTKLFLDIKNYKMASSSMIKLIDIYEKNNWSLKNEYQALINNPYIDDSNVDLKYLDNELKNNAKKAFQYATEKLETLSGIVESQHKSGKGFNVYISPLKKLNVRKSLYNKKTLPEIGTSVKVKIATDGEESEALEVVSIPFEENQKIKSSIGFLRLNDKGFGFMENVFIPPYLLNNLKNDDKIKIIKIWDVNPKTLSLNWRAIKVIKI